MERTTVITTTARVGRVGRRPAARPTSLHLREALGPGFAIVSPSEATLRMAIGRPDRLPA